MKKIKISSRNRNNEIIKINQEKENIENVSNKTKIDLENTNNEIVLGNVNNEINVRKITFAINLTVNSISGVITLMNINDTLKEWGVAKEGSGEQQVKVQLIKDVVYLATLGVDIINQYHNIKLLMKLKDAMVINANTQAINSQLKLNTLISKTVTRVTTIITVLDAITELNSAFDMLDMEDKTYATYRFLGSIGLIIGAAIALIGTLITIIIGVIFMVAGGFAILFSKKYDKYTPIQHWLNRCYFGKHAEFEHLGYDAYHEDDRRSHSGFGLALNDYTIAIYGIQTFIRKIPLYNVGPDGSLIESSVRVFQNHLYFYLDIPDFAKADSNEVLTVSIRLYRKNWQPPTNQSTVITDKYIDLKYRVSTNGIEVLEIKNGPETDKDICTDKKMFFNKYELPAMKSNSPSLAGQSHIHEPVEFQLTHTLEDGTIVIESEPKFSDVENVMVKQDDSIDRDGLIINKWIAGTMNGIGIEKYQIIIEYNNREAVPLIITKKSKKIN